MYALETTETLCRPAADNDLSGGLHVRMAVDVWYLCARAVCLFACVWTCFHECVCACVCNPLNQSEIAINRPVFTLVRIYTNPCKCQRYFSVFKCRPRLRLLVLSERIVHVQSAHRRGVCVCAQPKIVKFMWHKRKWRRLWKLLQVLWLSVNFNKVVLWFKPLYLHGVDVNRIKFIPWIFTIWYQTCNGNQTSVTHLCDSGDGLMLYTHI